MFARISRSQLRAVTGWSESDFANRSHNHQLSLAHGLVLPAENGVYLGLDCIAFRLSDELVQPGYTRAQAACFVLEFHEEWLRGLERIEWPELSPLPVPTDLPTLGLTRSPGVDVITGELVQLPPETEIYFAVARYPDDFLAASGTWADIVRELDPPTHITTIGMRKVYEETLAAAAQAGVDLGAPFTRPEGHPEHREWYAAVQVHRALSLARAKVRTPPGPAPSSRPRPGVRAKAKGRRRERSRVVRQAAAKTHGEQA